MRRLRGLLEGKDFVPGDVLAGLGDAVGCPAFREQLAGLQRQVDHFDYAAALATLVELECPSGRKLNG